MVFYSRIEGQGITYAILDGFKLLFFHFFYYSFVLLNIKDLVTMLMLFEFIIDTCKFCFYVFLFITLIFTIVGVYNGVVSPKSGSYVIVGPTGRALTALTACLFSIIWLNYYLNKQRKFFCYTFLLIFINIIRHFSTYWCCC